MLSQVDLVLEEFASRFFGKVGPVHHFWHTFDLAVTRFCDRRIDQPDSVDSVTREANSREVVRSGFWFGDADLPAPAFYSGLIPRPACWSSTRAPRAGALRAGWDVDRLTCAGG